MGVGVEEMWRGATVADLDTVMTIQLEVHPLLPESAAVMADKLSLFPEGCRILMDGDTPVAYALAHPFLLDKVPALDALLDLPDEPDCLYIHDVALLPPARGKGAGRAYIAAMRALARERGWAALALVSVYGTYPIWEACGFRIKPLPGLAEKFGPFGDTARYMTAAIG